jgi:hypothetical protein
VKLHPLTPEQIAWVKQQPVVGTPGIPRLRAALEAEDLHPVELLLNSDGETLTLWLARNEALCGLEHDQICRKLITIFRAVGFEVGYTELSVCFIDGGIVYVNSLVAPLETICTRVAVPVDR